MPCFSRLPNNEKVFEEEHISSSALWIGLQQEGKIRQHIWHDMFLLPCWHTETNVTGPSWRYILDHFRWALSALPSNSSAFWLFLDRVALVINDGLLETNLCFLTEGTFVHERAKHQSYRNTSNIIPLPYMQKIHWFVETKEIVWKAWLHLNEFIL